MSESQRITWLLSTPICAEVNMALQDYTSVQYGTSDQHKEQRAARQARDTDGTHKLIGYLSSKDPFRNDPTLQNIDTGITAGDSVNADQAVSVGRKILDGMVDKKVFDHTFKKKYQVVTFDTRSSVKTGKESVLIDPQLLFQRLIGLQDHAVMTSLMSSSTNYAVTHQHCFRPVMSCLRPTSQR